MALDFFTTNDGTKYAYHYTPAHDSKPSYLLLHGYPSSHRDWEHQIEALTAAGYGVLAPDLLGFGTSDMPTDVNAYKLRRLAGHMNELLDHQDLGKVIAVGHDWGAGLLSRVAAFHQDRLEKVVYLSVGHQAPGGFLDLDALNVQTESNFGYMTMGYWYFLHRYDSPTVIKDHLESYWHLIFPENNTLWKTHFAPLGAARAWLNADTKTEDPPSFDQAFKKDWLSWMSRDQAPEAGVNYYRGLIDGVNVEDDNSLSEKDWTLNVPVLAIGGRKDAVAPPVVLEATTKPWSAAGFELKVVDAGHWLQHEASEQISRMLIDFAKQ